MTVIIFRVFHTLLIYFVDPVISFASVGSRHHRVVTAFVEILFKGFVKAIGLVPLEGSVGHILLEGHTFNKLILILSLAADGTLVHYKF